jgi:hypothetical protein
MMSLDVYLTLTGVQNPSTGEHIFIRENGANVEISREEWDKRFPGREPVTVELPSDDEVVYHRNITHNLGNMADEAGIYKHLWRPDEIGITQASQLIMPLEDGLKLLESDPERFKQFNPSNGWGTYEGFAEFVRDYLEACEKYPDAEVYASR